MIRNKRKPRRDEKLLLPTDSHPLPQPPRSALNNFDDIKCEKTQFIHSAPTEAAMNPTFNSLIDHMTLNKTSAHHKNTMNFVEITKCILGMEPKDHDYSFNSEKTIAKKVSNCDTDLINADEFVSIENIEKFLGSQNMDYIDATLQTHLNADYFGGFY